jgi:hypothetical protein
MRIKRNDEAMSYFVPQVVGLFGHQFIDSGKPRIWNASGFPLVVGNECWLATAAHVVNDLRREVAAGRNDILKITDSWAGCSGTGRPISNPVRVEDLFVVGNDQDVCDLGAIRLNSLTVAALQGSGTTFLTESDWKESPHQPFDHFMMLGIPGEMVEERWSGNELVALRLPRGLFRLTKVDRPEDAKPTSHERFYGRISEGEKEGLTLTDISGVSGGPILGGTNVPGGVRFRVIALQSAWLAGIKTVTADYIGPLGEALSRKIGLGYYWERCSFDTGVAIA